MLLVRGRCARREIQHRWLMTCSSTAKPQLGIEANLEQSQVTPTREVRNLT